MFESDRLDESTPLLDTTNFYFKPRTTVTFHNNADIKEVINNSHVREETLRMAAENDINDIGILILDFINSQMEYR